MSKIGAFSIVGEGEEQWRSGRSSGGVGGAARGAGGEGGEVEGEGYFFKFTTQKTKISYLSLPFSIKKNI